MSRRRVSGRLVDVDPAQFRLDIDHRWPEPADPATELLLDQAHALHAAELHEWEDFTS